MKIKLNRKNQAVHFEAVNPDGLTVQIDGSPSIGGEGQGVRPMELMLMSLGGCSTIDIVDILKKMKQPLEDIQVEILGDRAEEVPKVFTKVHIHYLLQGELDPKKVERAINLSVTKYCSAAKMIDKTAEITYSFALI